VADWTLKPLEEGERTLFERLLQLYFYDFSEFDPDDVDETGQFQVTGYEPYGREPGHDAWLLRVEGKPAGFVLVNERSPIPDSGDRHYIHEFHVLRKYRRQGLGAKMAWAIFDRYPGGWQIVEIGPNEPAKHFWRRAIERYTGGRYRERVMQGMRFPLHIQEFDTSDKAI
jgi:predicted acetyltransferase